MYTIGQLALILKVSTRTLRHYDDIDLLKPYCINDENGYRYYEQEQISLAKNIMKLKGYGLALEEIKLMGILLKNIMLIIKLDYLI
ncbi:MerR family transcriptional regulator [Clostridium botulinum]|uniref:MerR family transcriptional regulator n=1 Tax=Clostridium botulinum TaxID=1491 RepID=UPI0023DF9003|nr:MerR family transcriptional regulator [Clostridium botulinum]